MGPLQRRPGLLSVLPSWRLAALLGLALIAPAALPAGGAERRQPELRRLLTTTVLMVMGITVQAVHLIPNTEMR